ncbi:MAG: hypothetical protein LBN01_00170 [Endomicrobium sp.]|nr:hypothetical protein [Endomicrobium sp.]
MIQTPINLSFAAVWELFDANPKTVAFTTLVVLALCVYVLIRVEKKIEIVPAADTDSDKKGANATATTDKPNCRHYFYRRINGQFTEITDNSSPHYEYKKKPYWDTELSDYAAGEDSSYSSNE